MFGSVKNQILLEFFYLASGQTDNAFDVKIVQSEFLRCNFDRNFD